MLGANKKGGKHIYNHNLLMRISMYSRVMGLPFKARPVLISFFRCNKRFPSEPRKALCV